MGDVLVLVVMLVSWVLLGVALVTWYRSVSADDGERPEPWTGPALADAIRDHLELQRRNTGLRRRAA